MSIAPAEQRHVADLVMLAAYDALTAHASPLDAVSILSTLGASPAALVETIERRLPHWAVYAYEVAISSHDLPKEGITEAALDPRRHLRPDRARGRAGRRADGRGPRHAHVPGLRVLRRPR